MLDTRLKENGKKAIRNLKGHYRSGSANLGADFFAPNLKNCTKYRRAVGYFSSSALRSWSKALPHVVKKDDVQIYLLIAPVLSPRDLETLRLAESASEKERLRQMVADDLVLQAVKFADNPKDVEIQTELLAWLVANERLILKFAFPAHVEDPGIYHEKIGVFDFPWGDKVAFVGSANETAPGHTSNYEVVHVYRSWAAEDKERVTHTERDFEEAWQGTAEGLIVLPLSEKALAKVKKGVPKSVPEFDLNGTPGERTTVDKEEDSNEKWRHQEEAVEKFIESRHGVLEMATGTGKTRTALKILSKLEEKGEIKGFIITTDGTDLLDQWHQEALGWRAGRSRRYRILRDYSLYHQAQSFALNPDGAGLIISRKQLPRLFRALSPKSRHDLAIIHDEVHGVGSLDNRHQLFGEHKHFGYTLGLSATPERDYDKEGTEFITSEIGPVIYQFELKDAIKRGILCEFDYVPLPYELTESDRRRRQRIYAEKSAREKQGKPMSNEEFWMKLSEVYKIAEQKPDVFRDYLDEHGDIIHHSIIFVDNRQYGERILPVLREYSHLYRTYYADDDKDNLMEFSRGKLDCLVTCHKLSQGIDIQHLKNVILFSSARAKLETIQRIGRCLRIDPSNPRKRAKVIDFVCETDATSQEGTADSDRRDWLSALSKAKKEQ